jgi:hypothetical protein
VSFAAGCGIAPCSNYMPQEFILPYLHTLAARNALKSTSILDGACKIIKIAIKNYYLADGHLQYLEVLT